MQPVTRNVLGDPEGQKRQAASDILFERLDSDPRNVCRIIADGYVFALYADGQYFVLEEYRGTDQKVYDSFRPANGFESHILRKIEGLNKFFIE